MTPRTLGWFYKVGIVVWWPVIATALTVALAIVACFGWLVLLFYATVSRDADGRLHLNFGV